MPLHTTTTIRIERNPGLADTFAALQINEDINGHHTFGLDLSGRGFGAGAEDWRSLAGQRITIEIAPLKDPAGRGPKYEPKLFTGLITGVQLGKGHGPNGHVRLTGGSPTLLLDDTPHTRAFAGQSLKHITGEQLRPYPVNMLRPQVAPATTDSLEYVVQYRETSWEFLQRLARTHGEWCYYDGEHLVFGRRTPDRYSLTHDVDLDDFRLQLGLGPTNPSVAGYDYGGDNVHKSTPSAPAGLNTHSQAMVDAGASLFRREGLQTPTAPAGGNGSRVVKHFAGRSQDAAVAGLVRLQGICNHTGLGVGDEVTFDESVYGKEAYGAFMLTAVHHSCSSEGDYSNQFTGVPADVAAPPHYSGDHPHAEAQSAIVMDNNDPEDLGRVQVRFRWQEHGQSPWLRMAAPAGGAGKGLYMIPEKGEEVMVGFEGGNPEAPYVLGTTWNGGEPSGFGTEKNDIKAIRTRSGHTIELNDKEGGEFITIKDKNGNSIQMDTKNKSITINAPEDMTLNAKNMEINIQENLKIKVGKSKTESIREDHSLEAKNSTTKILKQRMVRSGEKTEQQAGELLFHTSNGDMTLDGTGKVTIQSKNRIDFGE